MLSPVPALAVLVTLTCAPAPPWLDEMVQVVELEGLVSTAGQLNAAAAGCARIRPIAVTENSPSQFAGRGSDRRGSKPGPSAANARKVRFAVAFFIFNP
ncbi:hypothetical protein D3C87_1457550 [compost metagenome]